MPETRQYAFRLSDDQVRVLDQQAERLRMALGLDVNRTDALRVLLDFAGKVERIRKERLSDYRNLLKALPPGQERDRIQSAHDDWATMSYDRLLDLARLQAVGTRAAQNLLAQADANGAAELAEADIDAEVRAAREERRRRR